MEVFGREAIAEMGMGAFTVRGPGHLRRAADDRAALHGRRDGPHLGYVGKAVTFDTGGISLKPGAKMSEMKFDMSGGAAVLEAVAAIAELGLPMTLTAVIGATENMPSGRAIKPGDIVTARNGKTIEINNTDAEGRLMLADVLHYAIEQGAERIVNLATLTGRDHRGAGLHPLRPVLQRRRLVRRRGRRLHLHRRAGLAAAAARGDGQDGQGQVRRPGQRPRRCARPSSITAAEFLKQFVGDVPWVHMDIAGTAWSLDRPYVGNGASGFGVRALIELAREIRCVAQPWPPSWPLATGP